MTAPVSPSSSAVLAGPALWLALLALAMGGFGIGTGEFAIMGILPDIAGFYAMSEPSAGHLISAYALGVVVGAPLIAVLGSGMPRRRLAIVMMLAYAAANFASAAAPGFGTLFVFRFVSGLPHGAYFGVAALIAASLVPPQRRGYAVGRVMMGLTVAALAGNPFAIWLGQAAGWRYPFAAVGMISLITIAMIWRFVPVPRQEPSSSPMQELQALANGRVWMTLAIGAIGFGGMFAVMSYVAPIATTVTGLPAGLIPVALSVFGAGMVVGSYVGGWGTDRALMLTVALILVWSMAILLAMPYLVLSPAGLFLGVFLTGTCVALGAPLQVRLMDVAAQAQTLAASLNHSAFNLANALGAWLGGRAIEAGFGLRFTGWVGAGLAVAGLLTFVLAWWQEKRHQRHRAVARATSPSVHPAGGAVATPSPAIAGK